MMSVAQAKAIAIEMIFNKYTSLLLETIRKNKRVGNDGMRRLSGRLFKNVASFKIHSSTQNPADPCS
jgi:hypothetical protein